MSVGWLPKSDDYGIHMATIIRISYFISLIYTSQGDGMHTNIRSNNLNQERGYSGVRVLANVTGPDLLKSGNKAYMDLWNEKMKLEYALEAQRDFFLIDFSAYTDSVLQRSGPTIAFLSKSTHVSQEHEFTS